MKAWRRRLAWSRVLCLLGGGGEPGQRQQMAVWSRDTKSGKGRGIAVGLAGRWMVLFGLQRWAWVRAVGLCGWPAAVPTAMLGHGQVGQGMEFGVAERARARGRACVRVRVVRCACVADGESAHHMRSERSSSAPAASASRLTSLFVPFSSGVGSDNLSLVIEDGRMAGSWLTGLVGAASSARVSALSP